MSKAFVAGLILFMYAGQAFAIQAVVSRTLFSHDGRRPYIEIYWQIDPTSLRYRMTDRNTWETQIKTEIKIKNEKGVLKTDRYLLQTTPVAELADANAQSIIDLRKYSLPQGKIIFEVTLTDINDSLKSFLYTDSVTTTEQLGAFYSGIQLLDTVYASNEHSIFLKNSKEQIPMCANFLDDSKIQLHYYAELYNADKIDTADYPLQQRVFISRLENESPVYNLVKQDTVYHTAVQPATGDFSIVAVQSGNYYINFNLVNKYNVVIATKSLFFQRYNKHPKQQQQVAQVSAKSDSVFQQVNVIDLSHSFVMQYTLPELKAILKMLLPLANPMNVQTINGFLKNPDEGYIRYYIYNFFSSMNKNNPDAAWKDYANKIREVNKQFSEANTPGYETDRGAIYLRYGAPDERVIVEAERGALPYEIWQYNNINEQYKNAVFLFYRPNDMIVGFRLLHSTVQVEKRNTAWRQFLYPSGASTDLNSKAEQYIGKR